MRVLHLTTEFPWPATSGGPVRTLSQLRIIASLPEVSSITLLSVRETDVPARDVQALEDDFRRDSGPSKLKVVPPVFHPIHLFDFKRYVPKVVALRAMGVPYLAGKWDSRALRRALRRELERTEIDVAYIDHLGMARYLPVIHAARPRCRTVLDQHNVESDFFKQFALEKTGPKKVIAQMEYRLARRFEERALRSVDAVVAISAEDGKHFESLAGIKATVVPVVLPFRRKTRTAPSSNRLCYVGSLRWKPNVLGLDWFCQEVWPLVRRRVPDATLEIAGVGLSPDPITGALPVPDAWRVQGVETVGFLPDLEPLYDRAVAMIAPIVGGSGVRMKLLEGFRAGVPVVTTPDGAFGLPLEDGREALIARDPEAFAARVERVLRDAALRDTLRDHAYEFLDAHHSLEVAARSMRSALGLS